MSLTNNTCRQFAAAIGRFEDAALLVRPKRMPQSRDPDRIGIVRVDPDLADVARLLQPDVRPGSPLVRALVDPVAVRDVDPDRGFARAGINDIGIGRCDRDRPDRRCREIAIRDILPVGAGIDRFPDPARAPPEVEGVAIGIAAGDRHHATAPMRPHTPPTHKTLECRISSHGMSLV